MAPERDPNIAVVVPAFRVEKNIEEVVRGIPAFVRTIIVVDDCSPDGTGRILQELSAAEPRLTVITHERNQGVGGAVMSGYSAAAEQGADVVVKMDGDGQMDPARIEELVAPILAGNAEYTKGNRLRHRSYLRSMPLARRIGNVGLSFLIKAASGYWNIFDPTNGFTAISAKTIEDLPFARVGKRYTFESSMLVELYLLSARIKQIPMPAVYKGEGSSLNVPTTLLQLPIYLAKASVRRFFIRYVWQDFTAISVFVVFGLVSLLFGTTFGAYHWIRSIQTGAPATAGTVLLSAMPVILGFQLLLQAIVLDIDNTPG